MPGEDIQSWSTTAVTNSTADSSINFAEGQARASVNNSARSMMAAHAKKRNLENGSITTGGTANAQTFTSGVTYTTVPTGLYVRLKIGATNTGPATLNMDSIGAVAIKDPGGNDIIANALTITRYSEFLYNGTNWILMTPTVYGAPFDALACNGMQVNGSMEVSQDLGASGVASGAAPFMAYALDGWQGRSTLGTGRVTFAQISLTTEVPGFQKALHFSTTTTQTPLGVNEFIRFQHNIEGYRFARAAWGTSAAGPITVGFWMRATLTGSYRALIANSDGSTLSAWMPIVITAASTFQWVTLTFPAMTTGTWLTTNGIGATLMVEVTSPSTPNLVVTADGYASITGVIVIPGLQAPTAAQSPMIMRPYDQELTTSQRYWEKAEGGYRSVNTASGLLGFFVNWKVEKRIAPTCAYLQDGGSVSGSSFITFVSPSTRGTSLQFGGPGSTEVFNLGYLVSADARM